MSGEQHTGKPLAEVLFPAAAEWDKQTADDNKDNGMREAVIQVILKESSEIVDEVDVSGKSNREISQMVTDMEMELEHAKYKILVQATGWSKT